MVSSLLYAQPGCRDNPLTIIISNTGENSFFSQNTINNCAPNTDEILPTCSYGSSGNSDTTSYIDWIKINLNPNNHKDEPSLFHLDFLNKKSKEKMRLYIPNIYGSQCFGDTIKIANINFKRGNYFLIRNKNIYKRFKKVLKNKEDTIHFTKGYAALIPITQEETNKIIEESASFHNVLEINSNKECIPKNLCDAYDFIRYPYRDYNGLGMLGMPSKIHTSSQQCDEEKGIIKILTMENKHFLLVQIDKKKSTEKMFLMIRRAPVNYDEFYKWPRRKLVLNNFKFIEGHYIIDNVKKEDAITDSTPPNKYVYDLTNINKYKVLKETFLNSVKKL